MFRIPVYGVRLVKERTLTAELKRIRSAADAYLLAAEFLADIDREHFGVFLLDTQHQVRGVHTVTVGVLDASLVHPREVFKPAILASAASIILFHNHPSGDPTPSAEDRAVTRQLKAAGDIIGIDILDHIVVGDGRYVSFSEAGLL
jgi:DNA repair protein RadC